MQPARSWSSPSALSALLLLACTLPAGAASAGISFADPVFAAMQAELGRASSGLQFEGAARPYRIACTVLDASIVEVRAQAGAIVGADQDQRRVIDVDVRVGGYDFDNSNFDSYGGGFGHGESAIPIEDDPAALQRAIWLITDEAYKDALRSMSSKEAFLRNRPKAAVEDLLADYTRISPVVVVQPTRALDADLKEVEALVRDLARLLRDNPDLTHTGVVITAGLVRRRHLDTEGSRADTTETSVRLVASASAMADDGTTLIDAVDFVAPSMATLPPRADLEAAVKALAARVAALRVAPVMEDYDGPVLFEGAAAAQVMRHFLASNLSGTPAPVSSAASGGGGEPTFARKMNRPVMPKGWSVVDDPALTEEAGIALLGHYKIDHEGVEPRRVELIKDGRLVAQLASRIPSKHQKASDGHGRAPLQSRIVGHPGNLVIQSPQGSAPAALGKALLKLANDEGYDKALIVRRLADDALFVTGAHLGSPMASMGDFPRPTWAVMVDAKGQETLVRGASLSHVILRNLRDIAAASREPVVFNYLSSGVESGASYHSASGDPLRAVPTSIVTPAFILPHVEVGPDKGEARNPPLVPRPERR